MPNRREKAKCSQVSWGTLIKSLMSKNLTITDGCRRKSMSKMRTLIVAPRVTKVKMQLLPERARMSTKRSKAHCVLRMNSFACLASPCDETSTTTMHTLGEDDFSMESVSDAGKVCKRGGQGGMREVRLKS